MEQIDEELIQTLKKMKVSLFELQPYDQNGFVDIFTSLYEIMKDIPEEIKILRKLLNLGLQGLQTIYQNRITDYQFFIDALSETIEATEQYLLENPDREILVRKAANTLCNVLGYNNKEWNTVTAKNPFHRRG